MGTRCRGDETSRTPGLEARCNTRAGSGRSKPPGWCKTTKAVHEAGWRPVSDAVTATCPRDVDSSAPETVEGRSLEIE
jgi:hypothetical protein